MGRGLFFTISINKLHSTAAVVSPGVNISYPLVCEFNIEQSLDAGDLWTQAASGAEHKNK